MLLSRAQSARYHLPLGPRLRGDDNNVYFRNNQKISDTTKLTRIMVVMGKYNR